LSRAVCQAASSARSKLDAVRSGHALNLLLRPIAANWGRPNGIFAWDHVDVDALRLLLSGASGEGIATIVRSLCQNFRDMRDGFPRGPGHDHRPNCDHSAP